MDRVTAEIEAMGKLVYSKLRFQRDLQKDMKGSQ